jgi:hypothetical protein
MDILDGLRGDLNTLAVDLAAVRVRAALEGWLDGRKYDPHPTRQPAGAQVNGRSAGGQFASKPGGSTARGALRATALQAARASLTDPAAAAAAGPGAAALVAGGVSVSRGAGLYAHYAGGQAITPVLGLPGGKLEAGPPPLTLSGPTGKSESLETFDQDCEDQLDRDITACKTNAAMYGGGRGGYSRREIKKSAWRVQPRDTLSVLLESPSDPSLMDGLSDDCSRTAHYPV